MRDAIFKQDISAFRANTSMSSASFYPVKSVMMKNGIYATKDMFSLLKYYSTQWETNLA